MRLPLPALLTPSGGFTTCGYDAAGHVSEETKSASTTSARGIFYSALMSSVFTLISTIVWLFCIPPIEQFYAYTAPQRKLPRLAIS